MSLTFKERARVLDDPRAEPPARAVRPAGRWRNRIRATLVTAVVAGTALIWVYPFIWMVSASLKSNSEVFSGLSLTPKVVHLDNYVRAWNDAHISRYFFNSVFVTVVSVVVAVTATALIGYVLGRYRFAGRKVVIGVLAAAMFLPEGYTIIPIFDLISALGLSSSLWGVALAEAGGAHVVMILLFAGYFGQLPAELEEAAKIDGAGFLRTFFSVYLPLAKPVVATAVILQFMHSWNDFLLPLVLTLSRPELRTLSVGIYSFRGEHLTDWSAMAAASTIALLPIIVLFVALQRYFVESVSGAMKG